MNILGKLNLNNYKWWRNHRRVFTLGGFLLAFAFYLNPVVHNARQKSICAQYAALKIDLKEASILLGIEVLDSKLGGINPYCDYYKN